MNRRITAVAGIVLAIIVGAVILPMAFRGSTSDPYAELGLALQEDEIANAPTSAEAYSLTLSYIAWTRSSAAGDIPRSTIRGHLVDLSNELADWCSLCSAALDRELAR